MYTSMYILYICTCIYVYEYVFAYAKYLRALGFRVRATALGIGFEVPSVAGCLCKKTAIGLGFRVWGACLKCLAFGFRI